MTRKVELHNRTNGDTHLHLWTEVDDAGNFSISGFDLGPKDEWGNPSGYEWDTTVLCVNVAAVLALLGGSPDQDILEIDDRDWVPAEGDGLERLIRESGISYETLIRRR
jgi:hypothetical protein